MGNTPSARLLPTNDCDEGTDVDQLYYQCYDDVQLVHRTVGSSVAPLSTNYTDEQDKKSSLDQNNCTVFVGNISYRITQRVLWDFFSTFGTVTKTYIVMDHIKYHRRSRGIGFVTFSSQVEARKALTASDDELILDDRLMRVFPADRKQREIQHIRVEDKQDDGDDDEAENGIQDEKTIDYSRPDSQIAKTVDGIHFLPNDVLLYIFSFLGLKDKVQLERVCKRWQSVVLQSWQSLEKLDTTGVFGGFTDIMLTDNILRYLLRKGCWNLKELDLSSSPYLLTDWAVELIGQRCKKLVKLDLSSVKVTKSSLKFLASSCNQLKWIRLKKCNGFGEKGLWWLFHHCKLLEYVDISANYRISGQCFYMLSETLTDLILEDCRSVSDEGLVHLVKKCPRLQHLNLSGCVAITSTSIECLSKGLNHLKHLVLKGSYYKINQGGLSFLGLTSLQVLVITHNSLLTDVTVIDVCKNNANLRCLNIEGSAEAVSDIGVKAITKHCRNLEELNISYINKVSCDGLQSLCFLANLKKLSMKGCEQLSDEALTSIGSACLDLEFIDVTGCINVTEESIQVLLDVHSGESTIKTGKCLRLNIGATGVNEVVMKVLNSTHSNIHISTSSTLMEQYTRQDDDDTIILGGIYTDDEDDVANDDEELKLSNFGDFKTEWHDTYHDDDYHGYHEDFLEADDPFMEFEEWDVS